MHSGFRLMLQQCLLILLALFCGDPETGFYVGDQFLRGQFMQPVRYPTFRMFNIHFARTCSLNFLCCHIPFHHKQRMQLIGRLHRLFPLPHML